MRVLLVEDDETLRENLAVALRGAGYVVDGAGDGVEGQYLGEVEDYDAVILDLGLPERPGLEVLKHWRAQGNDVPVVVLTARDAWHERVDGLKAGADDYLGKPFHTEELLARLDAVIRRASGANRGVHLKVGDLELDEDHQQVRVAGAPPQPLTATEFRLLKYFMLHAGKILSKQRLAEHIYAYDEDRDSNVLEVYVRRLRHKIGKERIETLRGQGYRLRERP